MNNNIIKKPKASTRRESNPFYAPLRETTSTKLQNPQNVEACVPAYVSEYSVNALFLLRYNFVCNYISIYYTYLNTRMSLHITLGQCRSL